LLGWAGRAGRQLPADRDDHQVAARIGAAADAAQVDESSAARAARGAARVTRCTARGVAPGVAAPALVEAERHAVS